MSLKILILSGPTHEYIDPVRFIGNASSGLMGKALAEEATKLGHKVTFVSGPIAEANVPILGSHGTIFRVTSAEEMLHKAGEFFKTSKVIIFAAAIADYTPTEKKPEKMAKSTDNLVLELKATPDIAKTLCAGKTPEQIAIGFALQTSNGESNARRKLKTKNLNGIVLNTPATLGADTGSFSFLSTENGEFTHWGCINKSECAAHIFQALQKINCEK